MNENTIITLPKTNPSGKYVLINCYNKERKKSDKSSTDINNDDDVAFRLHLINIHCSNLKITITSSNCKLLHRLRLFIA